MTGSGPDRRDLAVARVALGVAAVGVAWLAWRNPAARRAVKRGAKFVLVTWLPAYVAGQVREAWANSAPPPATTAAPAGAETSQVASGPAGPAVSAFAPAATSE